MQLVRRGSELTTRCTPRRFARNGDFDVIVDEVNTLPYFAPLWSRAPTLAVHQPARTRGLVVRSAEAARCDWLGERARLPAGVPTRTDGHDLGFDSRRLAPARAARPDRRDPDGGQHRTCRRAAPKRLEGHLIAIGRLTPSKRYEHAIEALLRRAAAAGGTLTIVGDGPKRGAGATGLRGGIADAVRCRVVDEAGRGAVLPPSRHPRGPSAREGWGLTVTEAALRGTVSVVYDIPGFRDSVLHERTGLVTAPTPPPSPRVCGGAWANRNCMSASDARLGKAPQPSTGSELRTPTSPQSAPAAEARRAFQEERRAAEKE